MVYTIQDGFSAISSTVRSFKNFGYISITSTISTHMSHIWLLWRELFHTMSSELSRGSLWHRHRSVSGLCCRIHRINVWWKYVSLFFFWSINMDIIWYFVSVYFMIHLINYVYFLVFKLNVIRNIISDYIVQCHSIRLNICRPFVLFFQERFTHFT